MSGEGFLFQGKTKYRLDFGHVHTSGHATVDKLKRFADALNPKVLIPIHTFKANSYLKLFDNVKLLSDGKELCLSRD